MNTKIMLIAALAGSLTPATLPLPIYSAQASANLCMDGDPVLANIVKNSKPPQSASTIVHLTNVMFVVGEAIKTLDRMCTHEADYSSVRASYQASYDSAETACKQLASSASYCVPTRYVSGY